jgi:biopolymer transport protein TolR
MAMASVGRKGSAMRDINITPMIDVLLVLLVVFMVVQQAWIRQGDVQVPPPAGEDQGPPDPGSLVLTVEPGGRVSLNRQPLDGARLEEELREIFAHRTRKVLFVKGDATVSYGEVAAAVDAGVQAGVEVIGLVPE